MLVYFDNVELQSLPHFLGYIKAYHPLFVLVVVAQVALEYHKLVASMPFQIDSWGMVRLYSGDRMRFSERPGRDIQQGRGHRK